MADTIPQLAVIADDLTGACDTGVQFSRDGVTTYVCWDLESDQSGRSDILAVSTDSRRDDVAEARQKVAHICQQFSCMGIEYFYKKVDSTMRGNLGAEVDAVLETTSASIALVAPAFPEMGRKVQQGQLLKGEPPEATGLFLPKLLQQQSQSAIQHLDRDELIAGPEQLATRIQQHAHGQRSVFAIDATSASDLDVVAGACKILMPDALPVGSAGLAAALARHIELRPNGSTPAADRTESPVLVPSLVVTIAGSSNPVTERQVQTLLDSGDARQLDLDHRAASQSAQLCEFGRNILIRMRWSGQEELRHLQAVLEVVARQTCCMLIFTGGDTARMVCQLTGAHGILLEREVMTGLPGGIIMGGLLADWPVATKAGGFGTDDALRMVASHFAH